MIEYEVRNDAAWVTIDRPAKKNALSPAAHHELREILIRGSDEARVAVITGRGDTFCAGSDIEALRDARTASDAEALVEPEFELHRQIEALAVPVIAAVNGDAYGGGVELVGACDLAVAVENAEFALPETRLGLTPGYALDRATTLMGRKRVLELALTGDSISAETAREWGLLNRVVEHGLLETDIESIATRIADAPPRAVAAVKRTVNEDTSSQVSYQRSTDRLAALLSAEETQDRLTAFFERQNEDSDSETTESS